MSGELRVLVCGSRTFKDSNLVNAVLDGVYSQHEMGHQVVYMGKFVLIEGGAKGADALAAWWATQSPTHSYNEHPDDDMAFEHLTFEADWDKHNKAAGPIRNQRMLSEGKPHVCYAFVDKPLEQSHGTNDMVSRCLRSNVKTVVIRANG